MPNPLFSVIIVAYDMPDQVQRTVSSFMPDYQVGLDENEIEIIVLENGSKSSVPEDVVKSWPSYIRYFQIENALSSPAWALNAGVHISSGKYVCPVIDGARLASPGLFEAAKNIFRISDRSFITCLGYHIGHTPQQLNPDHSKELDTQLLNKIDWPQEPYRLFDISTLGMSARAGILGKNSEANAPILSRVLYDELNGFDESFTIAGGGFVNLDFFRRAVESPKAPFYLLLNEGTFHQFHGGVSTSHLKDNDVRRAEMMRMYLKDYKQITGKEFERPDISPMIYGSITKGVRKSLIESVEFIQKTRRKPS